MITQQPRPVFAIAQQVHQVASAPGARQRAACDLHVGDIDEPESAVVVEHDVAKMDGAEKDPQIVQPCNEATKPGPQCGRLTLDSIALDELPQCGTWQRVVVDHIAPNARKAMNGDDLRAGYAQPLQRDGMVCKSSRVWVPECGRQQPLASESFR